MNKSVLTSRGCRELRGRELMRGHNLRSIDVRDERVDKAAATAEPPSCCRSFRLCVGVFVRARRVGVYVYTCVYS